MKRLLSVLALLLAAGTERSLAWDHTGHMLVAQIAWNHLPPDVRQKLDDAAHHLKHGADTYNA